MIRNGNLIYSCCDVNLNGIEDDVIVDTDNFISKFIFFL